MAAMLYCVATSLASSTSHLRKFTCGYWSERFLKVGAIAWQGPHLASRVSPV